MDESSGPAATSPGRLSVVLEDQDKDLTGRYVVEHQANGSSRHPLALDRRYVLVSCVCGAWADYLTRPAPPVKMHCPRCPA